MAKKRSKKASVTAIAAVVLAVALWALEYFGDVDLGDLPVDEILGTSTSSRKKDSAENPGTEVHFVDVGQGDGALIISDGEAMVIDTGERDSEDVFLNYLKEQGIDKLKYLIITHPHTDHMGEAADIISEIETEAIIMPKITGDMVPTNSTYKNFLKTVKSEGLKITASTDTTYTLGGAEVQLFTTKEEHSDLNNYSTLVKVVHGDNSFLFTGDCEEEEEKEMLEQGFDLSATVLSAGHHGSSYSSTTAFLKEVNPQYAVVSYGVGNSYGHPHAAAVKRLKQQAENYYTTADDGNIIFLSDGEGLTVETEK